MRRSGFATRPLAGLMGFTLLLALGQFGTSVCRAQEWRPGENMKKSMVRLLAPVSVLIDQSDYRFSDIAYLGAFIKPGNYSYITTTLTEGKNYEFVGAGDDDVKDLDIIITDDRGRVVAEDTDNDATPLVRFTPDKTGRYTLKLKLEDARVSCFCGMALLERGGWKVPVKNLDAAMDSMLEHCRNVARQRPARFLDVTGEWAVMGTILEEGKSQIFNDIRLGTGRTAVTAGGDTVTRDIDLAIFEDGDSPKIIVKDEDDDAAPLVDCRTTDDRRYGVVIKNSKSNGGTLIFTAILTVD